MNSRERLTRLLNGQEIDRIPIWLLAPFHRIGCYTDIYNNASYKKVVEYIGKYCDTFDRRWYELGFCRNANPGIILNSEKRKIGANSADVTTMNYKDLTLAKYISKGADGTKVKFFVEDIDQLEDILNIPYVPPQPDVSAYFTEKAELGNRGLMMVDIGDPLVDLYNLMSAEDFSMFSLTEYDKILQFTDEIYRRCLENYKYLLDRDVGEVFFIVGAEFAGPPLVSPNKFNELSVRYVKGIVDLVRKYGKKSIVHYHGNLKQVLPGMKEINPDGLHTIEAPPIGDCTITQAREVLGNDMVLIGNVQYDDLVRKSGDEIEAMVYEAIEQGKGGRFILSPSAGPYEDVITPKTTDNYIRFIEAGLKYGKL